LPLNQEASLLSSDPLPFFLIRPGNSVFSFSLFAFRSGWLLRERFPSPLISRTIFLSCSSHLLFFLMEDFVTSSARNASTQMSFHGETPPMNVVLEESEEDLRSSFRRADPSLYLLLIYHIAGWDISLFPFSLRPSPSLLLPFLPLLFFTYLYSVTLLGWPKYLTHNDYRVHDGLRFSLSPFYPLLRPF